MSASEKKQKPLTPPDPKRCQAEVPNGHSFMTLGGRPGRERCKKAPSCIIVEVAPGKDGRCGSMSLCDDCLEVFTKQVGLKGIRVEPLQPKLSQYRGYASKRYGDNPLERAIALEWEKTNEMYNTLAYMLDPVHSASPNSPSHSEYLVAATVIQWLGSPVGQTFLQSVGFVRKEEPK